MKIAAVILGIIVLIVLSAISSHWPTAEQSENIGRLNAATDFCDKAMSDAKLGAERRETRSICDKMKADLEQKARHP